MQSTSTSPSRNQSSAAAIPSQVSVPERQGSPGTAPSTGTGQAAGSSVKGFDGALKPGKV